MKGVGCGGRKTGMGVKRGGGRTVDRIENEI